MLAVTNSKAALKHIAAATTTQYTMIHTSLNNLAAASPTSTTPPTPRPAPRNTPHPPLTEKSVLEKKIKSLQAAYKNKWVVGGF